jgi:drug/metabolite transporter (DMT)-like permease
VFSFGLVCALLAACCSAGAAVLQALGISRVRRFAALDVRLLYRLLRSPFYVAGMVLDGLSTLFTLTALHNTPLFVVQAIGSANLALIAVVSVRLFRIRLRMSEWTAVGGVCVGITLLVLAQAPRHSAALTWPGKWGMLAGTVGLAALAVLVTRRFRGAALPGLLAGLTFGDSAIAGRVIARVDEVSAAVLLNPVLYTLVLAGVLGTLLYAMALQRGSVTAASGLSTAGQTLVPALTGWFALGDSVRSGLWWLAALGFCLAVAAALGLGRHAHPVPAARPSGPRPAPGTRADPAPGGRLPGR